jgi:hypothetical protein
MSFSSLMKDTVSLLKKNGEKTNGIRAGVQKRKIFIDRSDILIETGDLIQRKMSNGGEETYEVIDPGFYERHGGITAHYQMDVKKLVPSEAKKTTQNAENKVNIEVDSLSQESAKEKAEGSVRTMPARSSKDNWKAIESEFGISKNNFGRKINFVSDSFKRKIIFRDVEHAFVLASQGFSKPALILAGGVIEELLRLYLEHKKIKPKSKRFVDYIKACEDNGLLKRGVSRLTDSVRDFRNLVHLDNEEIKKHTISKATAKGAVASIFTIANDF